MTMKVVQREKCIYLACCFCLILLVTEVSSQVYQCSFSSSDTCSFTQSTDDVFDWTVGSGSTPSDYTGPSRDHTTGSTYGGYIFIEVTSRVIGDNAVLLSPRLSASNGLHNCTVKFWYHMNGADIGTLNVYTGPADDYIPFDRVLKWTLSGNQLDSWHFATFSFLISGPDQKVEFEGVRGTDYTGDIALDDIEIALKFIGEPDSSAPVVTGCPIEVRAMTEQGTTGTIVSWTEPNVTDQSSIDTIASHSPGSMFPIGPSEVVYIYRDPFGNTALCSFQVIVETVDTTGPNIIDCPSNVTAITDLTSNGTIVSWIEPNATDLSGTPRRLRSHAPSTEFPVGVTWVTYQFVDTSNNVENCTFAVTVDRVDLSAPVIHHCPSDLNFISGRRVTWTEPTAFDYSGNFTISKSHSPGLFPSSTTRVVYTFSDPSSNIAYCTFDINMIYDETPPVIMDCPSTINASAEIGESETIVSWNTPIATDDYDRVSLVHSTHVPGESFPIGSTLVVYTFADDSYNTAQCNFSVIVHQVDTTPPAILSCPSDIVKYAELGTPGPTVSWSTPSAMDISGTALLMSQTSSPGDIFTTGTTNVVYKFVDNSGNEELCQFSVTILEVDTRAPTITDCPPDMMASKESARFWKEPSATDASGNVSLVVKTHSPGEFFPVGSTNVIYMFTDSSNNIVICSFNIYVNSGSHFYYQEDTTAPVLTSCPSDIHQSVELGVSQVVISWSIPTAIDDYGSVSLVSATHNPVETFPVGSTTAVSYVFEDDANNRVTCSFSVIVTEVDTTPPSIDYCPEDLTETVDIGVTTANASWTEPRASDLSGSVTLSPKSRVPTIFSPLRYTSVVYIFTDKAGNEATCQFLVSFETVDLTPPNIISCPSDVYSTAEVGTSGIAVTWNNPSVTDLSGDVTITSSHLPGQIFPVGSTVVGYQFEDQSLNHAECNFTVHVTSVDTTPPNILFCPDDISDVIELEDMTKTVSWSEPNVFDSSGNVSLASQSHFSGDNFEVGKTEIKYVFVDGTGNEASCDFHVVLISVDTTAPTIVGCPSDISAVMELGTVATPISWTEPTAVDASGNATLLTQSHFSGGMYGIGSTPVMYLFRDAFSNIATCTFVIRTETVDSSPPNIIGCPSDIYMSLEVGSPGLAVYWNHPTATDHSGDVKTSYSHEPGQVFPVGSTNIVYKFEDKFSNLAECNFKVHIVNKDTKPPKIINCPSDILVDVEVGSLTSPVFWQEPYAVDASGNVTLVVDTHSPGQLFEAGSTTIMYIFSDSSNNIAVCSFAVIANIIDTVAPNILNCPLAISSSVEIGLSEIPIFWDEPSATDRSGRATLRHFTHTSGHHFPVGTTAVSYVFVDDANNIAFCNFSVIIDQVDSTPPEIIRCPSDLRKTVEIGTTQTKVFWNEPAAIDNSGNVMLLHHTHRSGAAFTLGSTSVSYTFADGSENSVTCRFTVIVSQVDTTPPTIHDCPDSIQTNVTFGSFGTIVSWEKPTAEDASGDVILLVQTHLSGTFFAIGSTIVTYIFTDNANNMERCSFSVTVAAGDTSGPLIVNCPSDILANIKPGENETTVTWIEPFAFNLPADTKILNTHELYESFKLGSTPVSYIFEDSSGKQQFCNFTVIVMESGEQGGASASKGHSEELTGNDNRNKGVSIAALFISLLVLLICCIILILIFIRKKEFL